MGNSILNLTNDCKSEIKVRIEGTRATPQNFTLKIGKTQKVEFEPASFVDIIIGDQRTPITGSIAQRGIFNYTATQINGACRVEPNFIQIPTNCINMRKKMLIKL